MAIGMRSDPERIQELIEERERRERAWRDKPEHSFGEVLADAEEGEKAPEGTDSEQQAEATATEPAAEVADAELPRVPPDPRMAALHQMLDEPKAKPSKPKPEPEAQASAPEPIDLDTKPRKKRRRSSRSSRPSSRKIRDKG
jgi:hypothetical protein